MVHGAGIFHDACYPIARTGRVKFVCAKNGRKKNLAYSSCSRTIDDTIPNIILWISFGASSSSVCAKENFEVYLELPQFTKRIKKV